MVVYDLCGTPWESGSFHESFQDKICSVITRRGGVGHIAFLEARGGIWSPACVIFGGGEGIWSQLTLFGPAGNRLKASRLLCRSAFLKKVLRGDYDHGSAARQLMHGRPRSSLPRGVGAHPRVFLEGALRCFACTPYVYGDIAREIERWALFMGGPWSPKQGRGPVTIRARHARRITTRPMSTWVRSSGRRTGPPGPVPTGPPPHGD
jgi:hypothetical protein